MLNPDPGDAGRDRRVIRTMNTVDSMLRQLEDEMPQLQLRHRTVFALANAWAERYEAIIALALPKQAQEIDLGLPRIGIRWGLMPGARVTREFTALGAGSRRTKSTPG